MKTRKREEEVNKFRSRKRKGKNVKTWRNNMRKNEKVVDFIHRYMNYSNLDPLPLSLEATVFNNIVTAK